MQIVGGGGDDPPQASSIMYTRVYLGIPGYTRVTYIPGYTQVLMLPRPYWHEKDLSDPETRTMANL